MYNAIIVSYSAFNVNENIYFFSVLAFCSLVYTVFLSSGCCWEGSGQMGHHDI